MRLSHFISSTCFLFLCFFVLYSCKDKTDSDHNHPSSPASSQSPAADVQPASEPSSSSTENSSSSAQSSAATKPSNLDFLKKLNEKYPFDEKLLDNPALVNRLKKLIGESRFNYVKKLGLWICL